MQWLESLLIIGGVSLDIFATMECQGSVVAKIEKKGLAFISCLVCIWQLTAFSAGSFLASFFLQSEEIAEKEQSIGNGIAVIIYVGLGIHLIMKAVRNEKINEHREESFNRKSIWNGMVGVGGYTLLAGIAFGFAESGRLFCMTAIVILSVLAVIAGTYTGYHYGFAPRRKAYGIGGVLLWIAGIESLTAVLRQIF